MIDTHIHIGQFEEVYYDPLTVMAVITAAGVDEAVYTSTTSCKDGVLYTEIEREITAVVSCHDPLRIQPYLWYNPDYARQGLTVETAFATLPYRGFKIHPRAHLWDLGNTKTFALADELFACAAQKSLPVLIHTGYDTLDEAQKFEPFFKQYPAVRSILAHCRPLDQTIRLLGQYPNVYCDTAFVPKADLRRIAAAGFAPRILPGTDFPITHYFARGDTGGAPTYAELAEQYAADITEKTD
ncbi:amidohydrolase [Treponema primitia]|uniref:amidohydrolase family protein n=1 Tax=Treponema primitia TaxID=88058 RepID=UPI0039801BE9